MRDKLAEVYIKGSGLEIGALHCPTPVPRGTNVTYVDREESQVRAAHKDVEIKVKDWIVDDATWLINFKPSSQDFIIANHVLEHLTNPIQAVLSWTEKLKSGGVILFSIPNKQMCFDRKRENTSFLHIVNDFLNPNRDRDFGHYLDWYLNSELELKPYEQAMALADRAHETNANIHFHCWDSKAAREMVSGIVALADGELELIEDSDNGAEIIFVLTKK